MKNEWTVTTPQFDTFTAQSSVSAFTDVKRISQKQHWKGKAAQLDAESQEHEDDSAPAEKNNWSGHKII